MKSPLDGSRIWLVGASTGIGHALTRLLAPKAASLYISSRSEDALVEIQKELSPHSVYVVPCDVGNEDGVKKAYQEITRDGKHPDVLIYNAGIYYPSDVLSFNANEYISQMDINYSGALRVFETILPQMLKTGSGNIVGVSSVGAYRALPRAAGYGASKAALTYFMESMRMHVESKGVKVTVVSPGFVKTRLTSKNDFEMPFIMTPEEAAKAIVSGIENGKSEIHFPKRFSIILKLLGLLPERLYRRIMIRFVLKES